MTQNEAMFVCVLACLFMTACFVCFLFFCHRMNATLRDWLEDKGAALVIRWLQENVPVGYIATAAELSKHATMSNWRDRIPADGAPPMSARTTYDGAPFSSVKGPIELANCEPVSQETQQRGEPVKLPETVADVTNIGYYCQRSRHENCDGIIYRINSDDLKCDCACHVGVDFKTPAPSDPTASSFGPQD